MKNLLLIAITILAVGCGGKDESTTETKSVEENGQKMAESNYRNGNKIEGSEKFWNSKGDPVDTIEEARK